MAISDYKFCDESDEVTAIAKGESWLCAIGGKIAKSMSTGGAHIFRTKLQAEVFGRQLKRGYTGGTFLSADANLTGLVR